MSAVEGLVVEGPCSVKVATSGRAVKQEGREAASAGRYGYTGIAGRVAGRLNQAGRRSIVDGRVNKVR